MAADNEGGHVIIDMWSNVLYYDKMLHGCDEYHEMDDEEFEELYDDIDLREDDEWCWEEACWQAETALEADRENLSSVAIPSGRVLLIGEFGLWNRTAYGSTVRRASNVGEVMGTCLDDCDQVYTVWRVTADNELETSQTHHDGTNSVIFREYTLSEDPDDLLGDELDMWISAVEEHMRTGEPSAFDGVSNKLGPGVNSVFGW